MSIEVLVGNIASGKSTYAQERARQGAIVVSYDSLTTMFHGGFYTGYEEKLKANLYDRAFNALLITAVRTTRDVIVDNRNHTEAKRQRIIEIAKAEKVTVVCTVFDREDPMVHAARRHEHDDRGIAKTQWNDVAHATDIEWEEPNALEGFASITRMQMRSMDDVRTNTGSLSV